MDWWLLIRTFWAAFALGILCITAVILWRARGILSWKKSLKGELKDLRRAAQETTHSRSEAIGVIEKRCEEVLNAFSPAIVEIRDMSQFVISIASCFHPHADRPELQLTIGHFLQSLEKSLGRFERILERPGFKKLRSINIRKIKLARQRYLQLSASPTFRWYLRHRRKISQFSQFRFFLLPDPFTWLIFLSQRLTLLMVTKYLMLDLYLFLGKLALEAYDEDAVPAQKADGTDLEKILEELDSLSGWEDLGMDPQMRAIRKRLVGFSAMAVSGPTLGKLKNAIYEAADIISRRHFPDARFPLEEAALGPLLERTCSWIGTLGEGERIGPLRHLYRMRLDTLYRAKSLSHTLLPKPAQKFVQKTLRTYGWLKWPLKTYRWAKRSSPWRFALALGWQAAKKAAVAYLYGRTFDKACQELERVYSQSRTMKQQKRAWWQRAGWRLNAYKG